MKDTSKKLLSFKELSPEAQKHAVLSYAFWVPADWDVGEFFMYKGWRFDEHGVQQSKV